MVTEPACIDPITKQPAFYEYYVFVSADEQPSEHERQSGVYLFGSANGRHVEELVLAPSPNYGISNSDDTTISGLNLEILLSTLSATLETVMLQPRTWQVYLGRQGNKDGQVIYGTASREDIARFLQGVAIRVHQALKTSGVVHWGGGR